MACGYWRPAEDTKAAPLLISPSVLCRIVRILKNLEAFINIGSFGFTLNLRNKNKLFCLTLVGKANGASHDYVSTRFGHCVDLASTPGAAPGRVGDLTK